MTAARAACRWELIGSSNGKTVREVANDKFRFDGLDKSYYTYKIFNDDVSSEGHEERYQERSNYRNATRWMCTVPEPGSDDAMWTFDLFGPFTGIGGFDWHSFSFPDAGGFEQKLAEGPVYYTAVGYMPVDPQGRVLGVPPVHVHHMHVTSSQNFLGIHLGEQWRLYPGTLQEGFHSVEIDVHGDRQCPAALGGTDCLVRQYPDGVAQHLKRPMDMFADLNDVRPYGSEPLQFYSQNVFRWTRTPAPGDIRALKGVGLIGIGVKPMSFFGEWGFHDDFQVPFTAGVDEHYVVAGAIAASVTGSIVKFYWHTHHEYTYNQYVWFGTPTQLGLAEPPFSVFEPGGPIASWFTDPTKPVNLTAHGMTVQGLEAQMLARSCAGEAAVPQPGCPTLICSMDTVHRWEASTAGDTLSRRERYAPPACLPKGRLDVRERDVLTQVVLLQPQRALAASIDKWMHAVLYFYMIPNADSPGEYMITGETADGEPIRGEPGHFPTAIGCRPLTSLPIKLFTAIAQLESNNVPMRTLLVTLPITLPLALLACCVCAARRCTRAAEAPARKALL